jgi:hypothetical protein
MKYVIGLSFGLALALATPLSAAPVPPSEAASQSVDAAASGAPPTVAPAAPGVFTAQKKGANGFHLVIKGHKFTSRRDIELYMAYRASEVTMDAKGNWFTFVENRSKGDTAPPSKRDPAGLRYSFRTDYFRPIWSFKTGAGPAKRWSPFSGAAFPDADAKASSSYEVSADIVVHKGPMDDADPLAFEAGAVNDFLVNQVSPPQ